MTLANRTQAPATTTSGRLFFLDLGGGRVLSANPDGSDLKTVVSEGRKLPDGLVVDIDHGYMYWTNMGNPKANDGSIFRSDLDGRNMITIVPPGGTFTPKQLQLDKKSGKLYWSDREGMRMMRANLDGTLIETLVDTSGGDPRPGPDARKWCVGVAVDADGGKFYWTQKGPEKGGQGSLRRANIAIPAGQIPPVAMTSSSFTTTCLSRSMSTSISPTAQSTGRTAGTRRVATPSIARRWMWRRASAKIRRSFLPT